MLALCDCQDADDAKHLTSFTLQHLIVTVADGNGNFTDLSCSINLRKFKMVHLVSVHQPSFLFPNANVFCRLVYVN